MTINDWLIASYLWFAVATALVVYFECEEGTTALCCGLVWPMAWTVAILAKFNRWLEK